MPSADIHLDRLDMGISPSPDVVLDPVDPTRPSTPTMLDLDIAAEMGEAVKIDGFGLSARSAAACRCAKRRTATCARPVALDVAGRYRAYGQNLQDHPRRLLWSTKRIGDPRLDDARARGRRRHRRHPRRPEGSAAPRRRGRCTQSAKANRERWPTSLGRPLSTVTGRQGAIGAAKSALNTGSG